MALSALFGAALLFALGRVVGYTVLPSLRQSLYWSSWYFLVPDLMGPIGAALGALTARYRPAPVEYAEHVARINAPVFIGAGTIAILLPIWFMMIALNNEIVQKFLLNPNGWTHNHLPSTTTWFLSYYGLPFIWALSLMWFSKPFVKDTEKLEMAE